MLASEHVNGPHLWHNGRTPRKMLKMASLLTRPTTAVISPSRPESAKTASSPWDAPCSKQGLSSAADPRFTPHGSRSLRAMRACCWRAFSASCCVRGSGTLITSGSQGATDRSRHVGLGHAPPTGGWHRPSRATAPAPILPAWQPETFDAAPPPSADCANR